MKSIYNQKHNIYNLELLLESKKQELRQLIIEKNDLKLELNLERELKNIFNIRLIDLEQHVYKMNEDNTMKEKQFADMKSELELDLLNHKKRAMNLERELAAKERDLYELHDSGVLFETRWIKKPKVQFKYN
jgi:hypothetical protein